MYNKCGCACVLTKKRRTLSPLLSNHIIPLELTLPSCYIIFITDSSYQHQIELKRRCNCCPMIHFRSEQRQTSTDDMLVNNNDHVSSNNIRFNNVHS
jgi:hypothetical protein